MSIALMTLLVWLVAGGAGLLGSLTGLGGGVIVVPALTLLFHTDVRYAIGASIVSVIATSSGAAAAYVREGFTNIRVGMFLEVATTAGALTGAVLVAHVPTRAIAVVFGVVLLFSAFNSAREPRTQPRTDGAQDRLAAALRLDGLAPTPAGPQPYRVHNVKLGFGMMFMAGGLSGLLGIGSGVLKVLAMDTAMRIPFKVSTTTSNFMIGVTAATSAGVYLARGYIDPALALPVVLGVLPGALLGARILPGADVKGLRLVFAAVVLVIAVQMIWKGATGSL